MIHLRSIRKYIETCEIKKLCFQIFMGDVKTCETEHGRQSRGEKRERNANDILDWELERME